MKNIADGRGVKEQAREVASRPSCALPREIRPSANFKPDSTNCDASAPVKIPLPCGAVAFRVKNNSGFRGVYLRTDAKRSSPWMALIRVQGRIIRLGDYGSPEHAAMAYDAAALRFNGEFARLNFPKSHLESVTPCPKPVNPRPRVGAK